jgi:hypothetical protein
LLKTLKITTKTSAKTNQSAICFDDELKKCLRPGKTPLTSPVLIVALGVETRNGRQFFAASKQEALAQLHNSRFVTPNLVLN